MVFVLLGAGATVWITTYRAREQSNAFSHALTSGCAGAAAAGVTYPGGICATTSTAASPQTGVGENDATPPPASDGVPLSQGYASKGWAVVPGSLREPSALAADENGGAFAAVRLRNENSKTQFVDFDLWLFSSGRMVADLESDVNPEAKPGATVTVYLQTYGGPLELEGNATFSGVHRPSYAFTVASTSNA
jgi:hypothetical protein